MSWTKLEVPVKGMDTEAAPYELEKGYSSDVENCLTGRAGRLPVRGPLAAPEALRADDIPVAVWRLSSLALAAFSDGTLMTTNFNGVNSALSAAQPPGQTPSRSYAQTGRATIFGVGARDNLDNGSVMRWDGAAATLTAYANAPYFGVACAYWLNRLWLLDATTAFSGGGTLEYGEGGLHWSDSFVDGALPDTAAAWQDDVSGLDNFLAVAGMREPTALAAIRAGLVIFGWDSIHVLRGTSPTNVQLRREYDGIGCVSLASVVPWEDGVFFQSEQGFYYYDGVTLDEVSNHVRSEFVGRNSSSCSAARLDNRTIALALVGDSWHEPSEAAAMFLYDVPSRSWSRFTTDALGEDSEATWWVPSGGGSRFDSPSTWPQLLALSGSWAAFNVPQPRITERTLGTRETDLDVVAAPITATFKTRPVLLQPPDTKLNVRRLTTDYVSHADEAATGGWTATVKHPWNDATVATSGEMNHSPTANQLRNISDLNAEADEALVQMDYTGQGTDAESGGVEVHHLWVEHQPAQRGGSF